MIKMSNSNLTFIIGSVYMPIKSNVILFNEYFNTVELLCKKLKNIIILIFGDFNLPSANFSNASFYFNDKLAYLKLNQINYIKNSTNTMLDYILTNSTDDDIKLCINPMVPMVFHPQILATFTHHIINYLPIVEYIHNWHGAN